MTEEAFETRFRQEWEKYKRERNERLHRFTVRALIIFACLGLTTAATVYYVYDQADNNKVALCAVRAESEARIKQTNEFLEEHPNGIPGITRATFDRGLENQKATVKALSGVSCD